MTFLGGDVIFKPTFFYESVTNIKSDFLEENGIKGLILDLDNTLTTHNNKEITDDVVNWLDEMKNNNIKLMIVSNNHAHRVEPFAQRLKLDFIPDGKKPLTSGFNRAITALRLEKNEVAVVGDQIFTDILGANTARIRSIFVFPIEAESGFWFRVKRFIERPLLPKKREE